MGARGARRRSGGAEDPLRPFSSSLSPLGPVFEPACRCRGHSPSTCSSSSRGARSCSRPRRPRRGVETCRARGQCPAGSGRCSAGFAGRHGGAQSLATGGSPRCRPRPTRCSGRSTASSSQRGWARGARRRVGSSGPSLPSATPSSRARCCRPPPRASPRESGPSASRLSPLAGLPRLLLRLRKGARPARVDAQGGSRPPPARRASEDSRRSADRDGDAPPPRPGACLAAAAQARPRPRRREAAPRSSRTFPRTLHGPP